MLVNPEVNKALLLAGSTVFEKEKVFPMDLVNVLPFLK